MLCMPHPLPPRTPSLLSLSSIPELRFPPQLFTPPLPSPHVLGYLIIQPLVVLNLTFSLGGA